jgi:hypothetical protein
MDKKPRPVRAEGAKGKFMGPFASALNHFVIPPQIRPETAYWLKILEFRTLADFTSLVSPASGQCRADFL